LLARGLVRLAAMSGIRRHPLSDERGRYSGARLDWGGDGSEILRGGIKSFEVEGVSLSFFIENDFDTIQSAHRSGRIYEPEELAMIARHFDGGLFVDVGANVGNHSIYAAKVLKADAVIAFEPEPQAANLFEINVALNDVRSRVTVHRVGLADNNGRARAILVPGTLGETRLQEDHQGPIELRRGDELLARQSPGFIKIDAEGAELSVLAGLEATLSRCRPPMFVEVLDCNIAQFREFCGCVGYRVAEEFRRYDECSNLLVTPE
jgi:FkbM family methyltransferase